MAHIRKIPTRIATFLLYSWGSLFGVPPYSTAKHGPKADLMSCRCSLDLHKKKSVNPKNQWLDPKPISSEIRHPKP